MTHPDIIKLERDGCLDEPQPVTACCKCGEPIYPGDGYYHLDEQDYCVGYYCLGEYMKQFKRIAGEE